MPIAIGDIAGQHKTLLALVEQFPTGSDIILLGDLVDRGPRSNRVIEWAMQTPNVKTVRGNHEDMMLDFHGRGSKKKSRRYDFGLWDGYNGGTQTLESYGVEGVPKEHLDWLEALPLYIETESCFFSHSSWYHPFSLERVCDLDDFRFLETNITWNRELPTPRPDGKLQIFGHNSQWGYRPFHDYKKSLEPFAICLDSSGSKILTAYDTDTKKLYQQPYIK